MTVNYCISWNWNVWWWCVISLYSLASVDSYASSLLACLFVRCVKWLVRWFWFIKIPYIEYVSGIWCWDTVPSPPTTSFSINQASKSQARKCARKKMRRLLFVACFSVGRKTIIIHYRHHHHHHHVLSSFLHWSSGSNWSKRLSIILVDWRNAISSLNKSHACFVFISLILYQSIPKECNHQLFKRGQSEERHVPFIF